MLYSSIRRFAPILICAAAVSGLRADVILYSDTEFLATDWATVPISSVRGASMNLLGPIPQGGNPFNGQASSFFSPVTTSPGTDSASAGSLNTVFRYNPAVSGEILGITIGYDLRAGGSSGFSVPTMPFYSPLLRQGGFLFRLAGVNDTNAGNLGWRTFTNTSTSASDWVIFGGTSNPDFSAAGAVIEFGYRAALQASCSAPSGCGASVAVGNLDNFSVRIETPSPISSVPEPATISLTATALGLAAVFGRKRRS